MKTRANILKITMLVLATTALAVPTQPFKGWLALTQESSNIVIVHCTQTPELETKEANGVVKETVFGTVESDADTIFIFKGVADQGKSKVMSECALRQGEYYLVFGSHRDDCYYQATESYRIVPLGLQFSTNMILGETLDERIQNLLQRRLNNLNRQMQTEQEEKQRLEEGVKK